jgi:type VI secretion system protein ImpB
MSKQNLSIDVAVPNPLDKGGDSTLPVHLKFQSMNDFKPEAIIEQVDVLRDIQNIRNALVSVKGPLGNLPTLKKAIDDVLKNSDQRERLRKELEDAGIDLKKFIGDSQKKDGKEKK